MLSEYHNLAAEIDLQQAHEAPSGQAEPSDGTRREGLDAARAPRGGIVAPGVTNMAPPLVSVLINNHNYARYLETAIDSVLGQDYPEVELVVVDDGSTDNSRDVMATFGDRIVPVLKSNGGQGSAFNAGVAASHGDILCFLDADDTFHAGKVSRIAEVFREEGHAARPMMVHHLLALMDGEGKTLDVQPHGRTHVSPLNLRAFAKRYRFIWNEAGPTSGLCINRRLAQLIFPIPEEGVRISADDFVIGGASLVGELHCLPEVWGGYRIHGANNWYGTVPRKSREFRQAFEAYLNSKLIETGGAPVICFDDSIYMWDVLVSEGNWKRLFPHMLKLLLRYHDGYTLRFAYYALVKALRSLRGSGWQGDIAAEGAKVSREPAERISA
jgi:glycosyltransferase involved in cell wall biosynthesis